MENNNQNINPQFEELKKPQTFTDHINELVATQQVTVEVKEILNKLLDQIEPINYIERVYPKVKNLQNKLESFEADIEETEEIEKQIDRLKLKESHFLIETIEHLIELAESNNWGLCTNQGQTYVYNGAYWSCINKEVLQSFLGEVAERMSVSKYNARYYKFQENLVKQFYASAHLEAPIPSNEKILINLFNGTYEITPTKRGLRTFDSRDFMTYQLPFNFDSKAESPLFCKYLNRVLPDEDSQKSLAEFLGYIFVSPRTLKLEKALILYGSGANGKSVFFEVVNALLGKENITNYSLQSLTDEKGYQRAKLGGSLLNYASEISVRMDNAIFKQLVSGEPVDARLPYKDPFMLLDYGKLLFNCNRLPKDVEQTNAFFRRFLIVHFDVTIPKEEQDKTLHTQIIQSELSGVFNWMLQGLDRLLEQKGFTESESSKRILNEYRKSSNSVALFIDEHCEINSNQFTPVKDIYRWYKSFCVENNYRQVSNTTFRDRLQENGVSVWQERKVYVANLLNLYSEFIKE